MRRALLAALAGLVLSSARSAHAEAPPASPAKTPPPVDEPAEVYLRSADPRVILERRPLEIDKRGDIPGLDGWVPVCIAPCGVRVGRIERLRVAGSGVEPSGGFVLPKGPGPFTVQAVTGSAATQTAGLTLVISGGALLGLGGFSLLALQLTGATKNAGSDSIAAKMQVASITTLILSAVAFGVAFPFRFADRTTVSVDPGKLSRRAPPPRVVVGPGYLLF